MLGIRDQLLELAAGGPEALAAGLPEDWIDDYAVVGDPAECAQKIQKLIDAGSDTVELFPVPERASEYTQAGGRAGAAAAGGRLAPALTAADKGLSP